MFRGVDFLELYIKTFLYISNSILGLPFLLITKAVNYAVRLIWRLNLIPFLLQQYLLNTVFKVIKISPPIFKTSNNEVKNMDINVH